MIKPHFINGRKQGGYTLIEVAIGILILSIGILGMATMQINAKRLGYDALQRSIAVTLAHDIIERIRSNSGAIDDYVVTNLGGGSIATEPTPDCFGVSTCTATQLAAHDLWEWEQLLDGASEQLGGNSVGGLNTPRACITNGTNMVTVAIAWRSFQTLGSPSVSSCGEGLGLYGTNNEERQVVFFRTFIYGR